MSTKHIKRIGTAITGLALAILFSLDTSTQTRPAHTTITVKKQTHPTVSRISPRARFQSSSPPNEDLDLKQFQQSDFYRTLIDNNLFRPLGWTPPRPADC